MAAGIDRNLGHGRPEISADFVVVSESCRIEAPTAPGQLQGPLVAQPGPGYWLSPGGLPCDTRHFATPVSLTSQLDPGAGVRGHTSNPRHYPSGFATHPSGPGCRRASSCTIPTDYTAAPSAAADVAAAAGHDVTATSGGNYEHHSEYQLTGMPPYHVPSFVQQQVYVNQNYTLAAFPEYGMGFPGQPCVMPVPGSEMPFSPMFAVHVYGGVQHALPNPFFQVGPPRTFHPSSGVQQETDIPTMPVGYSDGFVMPWPSGVPYPYLTPVDPAAVSSAQATLLPSGGDVHGPKESAKPSSSSSKFPEVSSCVLLQFLSLASAVFRRYTDISRHKMCAK